MQDDRQLPGRNDDGFHPAQRTDLTGTRNEHGCLAAFVGEQLPGVHAPGRTVRGQRLRAKGGVQFAWRSLEPRGGVFDIDDGADGRGPGRADTAVSDAGARRVLGAIEKVTHHGDVRRGCLRQDNRREFAGAGAIRRWLAKEIVGDKVSIDVRAVLDHHGDTIVRGAYDGTFDKTSLPDEIVLSNYFSVRDGKIVSLVVIFNQPADY